MRLAVVLAVLALAAPAFAAAPPPPAAKPAGPTDWEGCKDHPLFTRLPGYFIYRCRAKQFDAVKFKVGNAKKPKEEQVEGKYVEVIYHWDKSKGAPPSGLQVVRNYQNALKAIGGKVLWESKNETTLQHVKDGVEVWATASEYGTAVTVTIVERQAMRQDVVASAEAWTGDLKTTGHATVYGIYFDTGSAVVKPESEPALQEIAKLLASDPSLKIWVVGHTDSVGGLESNLKLSRERAEAVRAALVGKHGVADGRLLAQGVGPLAPVATNTTDEGKARNRRVELVAQ